MTVNLNIVEKCVSCLNIKESYDLARRMEQEKTNPVLGYRTAGSLAERKTGEMLLEEMKKDNHAFVINKVMNLPGDPAWRISDGF